ncbi:MAG TPA: TIR domain-containing protein, partial [Pyrinomonadaceae bacterium]|nr:TIR domain-containing protein [Pyrinomonadaceae bacterium]
MGGRAAAEAHRYRNAKVVLLGDSGVGKSGLALVLTKQKWEPTESTHGRRVWVFDARDEALDEGGKETRETLLWDLAGQPGYRMVHQLHLNEVSVALVVFDARSETEPFAGVRHWEKALRQARRLEGEGAGPLKKYLVAARADRGGIGVSRERIEATVRAFGFDGYFETSAKEGWQIPELTEVVRAAVDWESLPRVSSNELFQTIKQFLIDEKTEGRLLSTADDLYRALCLAHKELKDDAELRAKFETCVGRVENRGLIRRLSFGDYVLLQPELLDAYASAMVNAAKSEPDGLGCIAEEDALAGRFKMPSDERVADKEQEKLLLIATLEELLRHDIVLKETSESAVDLVFPSQFTRDWPDAPEVPGRAVVFTFDGPVLNIYATLAVRLTHSRLFKKIDMWKNAAVYRGMAGGTCGIYLREGDEGRGELTLFFDAASGETRLQFEDYVAAHLRRRALPESVRLRRVVACGACPVVFTDEQVRLCREHGKNDIKCPVCGTANALPGEAEEKVESAPLSARSEAVAEMDRAADEKRDLAAAAMVLQGKIQSEDFDVFLCHNSQDKPAVKEIGERLKERGILPWLDVWELRPGLPWQEALERQIEKIKSAAVFVGPGGTGPWQNQELRAFLSEFVERKVPVIPVLLPGCDETPKLPVFLRAMTWVDFRKQEADPLRQLVWGITGEKVL